jgi:hypothetical protein
MRCGSSLFVYLWFFFVSIRGSLTTLIGDVVTKKRSRLLDASTRAIVLVKNWMGQPEVEEWELEMEEEAEMQTVGVELEL